MTGFAYAKIAQTATNLLAKFGQQVTFVSVTEAAYSTTTGGAAVTEVETLVTGVMLEYKTAEIDGTRVQEGDVRVYMEAKQGIDPKAGDKMLIDSVTWQVITSRPLKPGPVIVLHDLQLRR